VRQGRGTPRDLVEEARKPKSPAHKHFTFDRDEAAEKWLLHEARVYFRAISIVVQDVDSRPIPAFERITYEGDDEARYQGIEAVREDDEMMAQVLDRARDDLLTWFRRYRRYAVMANKLGVLQHVFDTLSAEFADGGETKH
jgi:hypothetical protein